SVVTLALNGLVIEIAEAIGVGVLLPGRVMAPTRKVVAVICARLAGDVPPDPSTIAPLFGASSTVGAEMEPLPMLSASARRPTVSNAFAVPVARKLMPAGSEDCR